MVTSDQYDQAAPRYRKFEGWLKSYNPPLNGSRPNSIKWQDCYCVLRTDELSFITYRDEQAAKLIAPYLPIQRLDSPMQRVPIVDPKEMAINLGYQTLQHRLSIPSAIQQVNGYFTLDRFASKRQRRNRPISQSLTSTLSTAAFPINDFDSLSTITENGPDLDMDNGTESLDRRQWHQRSNRSADKSSFHRPADLMVNSMPAATNMLIFPKNDLPGVSVLDGSPTTPQRLANFFSKPFRNPLKRTKSVSKLDRKRQDYALVELHSSRENVFLPSSSFCADGQGLNQNRTPLSLYEPQLQDLRGGRITFASSAGQAALKSSRSHESLLGYAGANQMHDLKPDARIHPVHTSVLQAENCFKFDELYYQAESPQERTRWLQSMKRTLNPNLDAVKRTENSLQIWVLEVKGVPKKARYYCELMLDRTLYARTSVKQNGEHCCFWGDFFDLNSLPSIENLCVNLYREADPKKKKDNSTLVGYIQLGTEQFKGRQSVEKWYTVNPRVESSSSSKFISSKNNNNESIAIRIKARYQNIEVLPLAVYERLIKFVTINYLPLCNSLEMCLAVKLKEDFSITLVRILHKQRVIKDFLCDIIMAEIGQLDNDHLMFRGNSLATKSMEAYIKLVSSDYLHKTLGAFVKEQVSKTISYEVDPMKLNNPSNSTIEANRKKLMNAVKTVWEQVVCSAPIFPQQLREVFDALRQKLRECKKSDLSDKLVSASIFLRYICPAILSPSLFGLVSEYPSNCALRNLTLIAKTLQTLANFTKFSGKENFMEFMNVFIMEKTDEMHKYLSEISEPPKLSEKVQTASNNDIDNEIDFGKELSCLHSYLEENWSHEMFEKTVSENDKMAELRSIVTEINSSRKRSNITNSSHGTLSTEPSTHSSANPPSDYENNGKSLNPSQSSQQRSRASSTASKRATPASSLNTSDDYVVTAALSANDYRLVMGNNRSLNEASMHSPQAQQRHGFQETFNENGLSSARSRILTTPHYYQSINETRQPRLASYDDVPTPSVRDDYVVYDDVPDNFTEQNQSLRLLNNKSTGQQSLNFQDIKGQISLVDDDTTDEDEDRTSARRVVPARKTKRKPLNADQASPKQSLARRTLTAPIPSSGYQSQNHSSYSSSSSSSSPVDNNHSSSAIRDHLIATAAHPLAIAQASIKFSNNNIPQNYPSATTTSYSSTSSQSHNNDDEFNDLLSTTPQRRPSSSGEVYNRYASSNGTMHSNASETSAGFESYTRSPQPNARTRSIASSVHNAQLKTVADPDCSQALIAEQRRQIEMLVRENESLKRALLAGHADKSSSQSQHSTPARIPYVHMFQDI